MMMNNTEPIFKQVKICETFEQCHVMKHLGHFDSIVPSLVCILTKQHGVRDGKTPLENRWKWCFQDSKFQNGPRCLGPQELVPFV